MKYFDRVFEGLDVAPILAELDAQPDLWDAHRARTLVADGPMAGTSDVWLRYFPQEVLRQPKDFLAEGPRMVFYPAWDRLPALHEVTHTLMHFCRGVELGGCLISRIPPGGEVGTHTDGAAWSARFYNRKFYIPLRANDQCLNVTLDETVVMRPGEIWQFDNLVPHSVHNGGETERLNLIISIRSADA